MEDRGGGGGARRGCGCGGGEGCRSPTDSYLAYREKAAAEVGAARIEDQADLDKKYAAEVNARLVRLVGAVQAKGFSGRRGVTCKALCPMMG